MLLLMSGRGSRVVAMMAAASVMLGVFGGVVQDANAATNTAGISGTVTNTSGAALAGICVQARGDNGGYATATSSTDGNYSLTSLPSGNYVISFDACGTGDFLPQYFDGVTDASAATPVGLADGQQAGNVDARLQQYGSISGTLTSSGAAAAGACVQAEAVDGRGYGSSKSNADGGYRITGLPAGTYRVQFAGCADSAYLAQWYDGAPSRDKAAPITVTVDQETAGVNAQLAEGGMIEGSVTAAPDNQPLANVCVSAWDADQATGQSGTTDTQGHYTLGGLAAGNYRIEFSDCGGRGLVSQYYQSADTYDAATSVTVALATAVQNVDAQLEQGGSIAGTVTNGPSPLANICVSARADAGTTNRSAMTGADGTYTIDGLPGGDYRVQFSDCQSHAYIGQYFDGASGYSDAQLVAVTAGESTPGVNATLHRGGAIQGQVTDQAGQPVSNIEVSAESPGAYGAPALTDANGNYTVAGLSSGRYTVRFSDPAGNLAQQYFDGHRSAADADQVSVTEGMTADGIDASLNRAGSISGTVTASGGGIVDGLCARAYDVTGSSFSWTTSGAVAGDGTYRLTGLTAGSYMVEVSSCDGFGNYVATVYPDALSLADGTAVKVDPGQDVVGIDLQIGLGGALAGHLVDAAGSPVSGVCVTADGPSDGFGQTDDTGAYSLAGLAAGDYRLHYGGCGDPYLEQWYYGAVDAATAEPITVTSGQTETGLDDSLVTGGQITGTVTDAAGNPVPGICVNAQAPTGRGATTDSSGRYAVVGLRRGSYLVEFLDCRHGGYEPQYFDGAADSTSATPVKVGLNTIASGVDAALTRTSGDGQVDLTVTDASGSPLSRMCVDDGYFRDPRYDDSVTDIDGHLSLSLTPGTHTLVAHDCAGGDRATTRQQVTVVAGQSSAVTLTMAAGGAIAGTVAGPGGALLAGACVTAVSDLDATLSTAVSGPQGTYVLHGVPDGTALVSAWPCDSGTQSLLQQWWQDQSDFTHADAVNVTADQTSSAVDFGLQPGASISGTVTDADQTPLYLMCVEVFDGNGLTGSSRTDGLGHYQINGLPAGTYTVQARDCDSGTGYTSQWYDAQTAAPDATPITLTAGQQLAEINFALPTADGNGSSTSLPGAPTITGVSAGNRTLTVSWNPPAVTGNSAVSDYRVTLTPGALTKLATGSESSATITLLTNGTTYTITVAAKNAAGWGPESGPETGTPRRDSTSVTLDVIPASTVHGQQITLSATVTGSGGTTPTGDVVFYDADVALGNATLDGDTATLVTDALTVGSHDLRALYAGDDANAPGDSSVTTVDITKAQTSTSLNSDRTALGAGETLSLTAEVATLPPGAGVPTGKVVITDTDGTVVSSADVDGAGAAVMQVAGTGLGVGTHMLTATYPGNENTTGSTSQTLTVDVVAGDTTTKLSADPTTSTVGSPVTFTAAVTATDSNVTVTSGTIDFLEGETVLGTTSLSDGTAAWTTSTLAAGTHDVTARYSGDALFNGSTSATVTATVQHSTTTTVEATRAVSVYGQPLTLTATVVRDDTTAPAGTVWFYDGKNLLGTGQLDSTGTATYQLATPEAPAVANGYHITATYGGDTLDASSTSTEVLTTVEPADTTVTLTSPVDAPVSGQHVELAAQVHVSDPGAGTPTGQVTFTDGDTTVGVVTLAADATATLTIDATTGSHVLVAEYSGNAAFHGSTSAPLTLTGTKATTTTTLSGQPNPADPDQPVTLTATVEITSPGNGTPTGAISITDAGTDLGTATLDASGQATLTVTTLNPGNHSLTAHYDGDSQRLASTSDPLTERIRNNTQTTLTTDTAAAVSGQPVRLTATTTSSSPSVAGQTRFLDGDVVLGTATVADTGVATLDTGGPGELLAIGTHQLSAEFIANDDFTGSSSEPATIEVTKAATSMALTATSTPVSAVQDVSLAATVSVTGPGAGTPTGTVTFQEGDVVLATADLASDGTAIVSVGQLTSGSHHLTATWPGTGRLQGSNAVLDLDVVVDTRNVTSVALSTPAGVFYDGDTLTVSAKVSSADGNGTPTGFLTFSDGTRQLGIADLKNGTAQLDVTLTAGTHQLTAAYSGDQDYQGSSSIPLPVQVQDLQLVASAGDDQAAASGEQLSFDGTASRPLDNIDSYDWDFGDSSGGSGARPEHTYTTAGSYTVTLTVTRGDKTASDTAEVVVAEVGEPALAVTVTGDGATLAGASVMVIDSAGVKYSATTDAQGSASLFALPDGDVTVYSYATGYRPTAVPATVSGGSGTVVINLTSGQIATGTITSRPMTLEEIKAAGIDPTDPANQNAVQFTTELAFLHAPVTGIAASGGFPVCPTIDAVSVSCDSRGAHFSQSGYSVTVGVNYVDNLPQLVWLVVPARSSWLKEFFEVDLMVTNLADESFTLDHGSATLTLPAGLSLAPTTPAQHQTQTVADIVGGTSATTAWIVRGDKEGEYDLAATYVGDLEPFGDAVTIQAATADPLHVWGASALSIAVEADDSATVGRPYHATIALKNLADAPIYNLELKLSDSGQQGFIYQPRQRLARSTDRLDAGDWLKLDVTVVPTIAGALHIENSVVAQSAGGALSPSDITTRPAADTVPEIRTIPLGGSVGLMWDPVDGASDYMVFSTSDRSSSFEADPVGNVTMLPPRDGKLRAVVNDIPAATGAFFAISSAIDHIPTMLHDLIRGDAVESTPGPSVDWTLHNAGASDYYDEGGGSPHTCGTPKVRADLIYADDFYGVGRWEIRIDGELLAEGDGQGAAKLLDSIDINVAAEGSSVEITVWNLGETASTDETVLLDRSCPTEPAVVLAAGFTTDLTDDANFSDKPILTCPERLPDGTTGEKWKDAMATNACDDDQQVESTTGNLVAYLERLGFRAGETRSSINRTLLEFSYEGADVNCSAAGPQFIPFGYTANRTTKEIMLNVSRNTTATSDAYLDAMLDYSDCWYERNGYRLSFTVVGHSLGGYEALGLARRASQDSKYDGLISTIVSVDGAIQPGMVVFDLSGSECLSDSSWSWDSFGAELKTAAFKATLGAPSALHGAFYDYEHAANEIHDAQKAGIRVATVTNAFDGCLKPSSTLNAAADHVETYHIDNGSTGTDKHSGALQEHMPIVVSPYGHPYPLRDTLQAPHCWWENGCRGIIPGSTSLATPLRLSAVRGRNSAMAAPSTDVVLTADTNESTTTLIVHVTDSTGAAARHATGVLEDADGQQVAASYGDAQGDLRLSAPAGTYTLAVAADVSRPTSRELVMPTADDLSVSLEPTAPVNVTVKDDQDAPLSSVLVGAFSGGRLVEAGFTNGNGQYQFLSLDAGGYEIRLDDPLGRSDLADVALPVEARLGTTPYDVEYQASAPPSGGGGTGSGGGDNTGGVIGDLPAGGTQSSQPPGTQPSAETPVITTVTTPRAGTVSIKPVDGPTLPDGVVAVGPSQAVTAPATSTDRPLTIELAVPASAVPTGMEAADLKVFAGTDQLPWCLGATATQTPCVTSVDARDGVVRLTVVSVRGATFTVGADQVNRLSGQDRILTSVATAQHDYPGPASAHAAVLASADAFPDALAGAALASAKRGPLLLTSPQELSDETAAELQRVLAAGSVIYVLGGTAALDGKLLDAVSDLGYMPMRLAGRNRYQTAARIAAAIPRPSQIMLTTGRDFPDALAAGAAAAARHGVVLLTDGPVAETPTTRFLQRHPDVPAIAIGGPAAEAYPDVARLVGANRYATAAKVATRFFPSARSVGVASGEAFPDALAAGPGLAEHGRPILLARGSAVPNELSNYWRVHGVVAAHVYGGNAAVSPDVVRELRSLFSEADSTG